ncbi:uncharacterized protein [Littorina saxatilis]|uniref:Uncharacterized protein n=1 Tax=Littorina saxatilis TaxID=31220 RepID=A0AAN9BJ10_9CAEN
MAMPTSQLYCNIFITALLVASDAGQCPVKFYQTTLEVTQDPASAHVDKRVLNCSTLVPARVALQNITWIWQEAAEKGGAWSDVVSDEIRTLPLTNRGDNCSKLSVSLLNVSKQDIKQLMQRFRCYIFVNGSLMNDEGDIYQSSPSKHAPANVLVTIGAVVGVVIGLAGVAVGVNVIAFAVAERRNAKSTSVN